MRLEYERTKNIIADRVAGNINNNIKFPNVVDNVHRSQNISGVWQEHYSQIFNVVKGSCTKEYHAGQ